MSLSQEAKNLAIVFREYGASQEAFAHKLGVTQGTVSRMLKGEYPITEKVIKSVCIDLGYSPAWFIKNEGPRKIKGDKPGKLIIDISEFRTDLQIINAKMDKLTARLKYLEDQFDKNNSIK